MWGAGEGGRGNREDGGGGGRSGHRAQRASGAGGARGGDIRQGTWKPPCVSSTTLSGKSRSTSALVSISK